MAARVDFLQDLARLNDPAHLSRVVGLPRGGEVAPLQVPAANPFDMAQYAQPAPVRLADGTSLTLPSLSADEQHQARSLFGGMDRAQLDAVHTASRQLAAAISRSVQAQQTGLASQSSNEDTESDRDDEEGSWQVPSQAPIRALQPTSLSQGLGSTSQGGAPVVGQSSPSGALTGKQTQQPIFGPGTITQTGGAPPQQSTPQTEASAQGDAPGAVGAPPVGGEPAVSRDAGEVQGAPSEPTTIASQTGVAAGPSSPSVPQASSASETSPVTTSETTASPVGGAPSGETQPAAAGAGSGSGSQTPQVVGGGTNITANGAGMQQAVASATQTYAGASGSTDFDTNVQGVLYMGVLGLQGDLANYAKHVQGNLDAQKGTRQELSAVTQGIANWPQGQETQSFTWTSTDASGKEVTQTADLTREQATGLQDYLQSKLQSMSDQTELDQLNLQQMTQNYQQGINTISNVMKMSYDTVKSVISNIRSS